MRKLVLAIGQGLLGAGVAAAQSAGGAIDPGAPAAPSGTWTVFGMDSTAGVMIGVVLMLVFILAIVAVSRNERTTIA